MPAPSAVAVSDALPPATSTLPSTPLNNSCRTVAIPRAHERHFYADGTIILVVQDQAFRLHGSILRLSSTVFKDMLNIPVPNGDPLRKVECQSELSSLCDVPVVHLHGDSAYHFGLLLDLIIHTPGCGSSPCTKIYELEEILGILKLADKYDFECPRNWGISQLKKQLPIDFGALKRLGIFNSMSICSQILWVADRCRLELYSALALYGLATQQLKHDSPEALSIFNSLSGHDCLRMHVGLQAIRNFVFKEVGASPAFAQSFRCESCDADCMAGFPQLVWGDIEAIWRGLATRPLQHLHTFADHSFRSLCALCNEKHAKEVNRILEEAMKELPRMFGCVGLF